MHCYLVVNATVKTIQNITSIFPKHVFWDMDYSKLSYKEDKDIIIPRALYATTKDTFDTDIIRLEEIYSKKLILKTLRNTKERISNEICKLVSKRYNVAVFYRYAI